MSWDSDQDRRDGLTLRVGAPLGAGHSNALPRSAPRPRTPGRLVRTAGKRSRSQQRERPGEGPGTGRGSTSPQSLHLPEPPHSIRSGEPREHRAVGSRRCVCNDGRPCKRMSRSRGSCRSCSSSVSCSFRRSRDGAPLPSAARGTGLPDSSGHRPAPLGRGNRSLRISSVFSFCRESAGPLARSWAGWRGPRWWREGPGEPPGAGPLLPNPPAVEAPLPLCPVAASGFKRPSLCCPWTRAFNCHPPGAHSNR